MAFEDVFANVMKKLYSKDIIQTAAIRMALATLKRYTRRLGTVFVALKRLVALQVSA